MNIYIYIYIYTHTRTHYISCGGLGGGQAHARAQGAAVAGALGGLGGMYYVTVYLFVV